MDKVYKNKPQHEEDLRNRISQVCAEVSTAEKLMCI